MFESYAHEELLSIEDAWLMILKLNGCLTPPSNKHTITKTL